MSYKDAQIAAGLRSWAELHEPEATGEHPAAEVLAAYVTGEFVASDADRVRDHLILCRACSAIVLELSPESAHAACTEWQELQARIGEMPRPGEVAAVHQTTGALPAGALPTGSAAAEIPGDSAIDENRYARVGASGAARRSILALVAALAGMVIGGVFGIGYQPPHPPSSDVQVATVAPAVRGIPPRKLSIEVNSHVRELVVLLPTFANRAPRYQVSARNETDSRGWQSWEATADELGNIPINLNLEDHGLGHYRIELAPIGSEDPSALVFEIELVAKSAEPASP